MLQNDGSLVSAWVVTRWTWSMSLLYVWSR